MSWITENDAPVVAYCAEEVWRQGHNTHKPDGWLRVAFMLNAWSFAYNSTRHRQFVTLEEMIEIGKMVEPTKNAAGIRRVRVQVGLTMCPEPEEVMPMLEELWRKQWSDTEELEPFAFYRAFLNIHPFVDGNGRTAKILLNMLNDTMERPVFPPNDFWGRRITNP